MSEAIIAKKAELVDVVAEKMKAAASIVVVDSRGLTVDARYSSPSQPSRKRS